MSLERWREAVTWAELCELGAAFLEGELGSFPGWLAPDIDEETDPHVDTLAAACRAGFLTTSSQPGHPRRAEHDEVLYARRAFVTGFCDEAALTRLARHEGTARAGQADGEPILRTFPGLTVHVDAREPVALRGGEPFLWVGHDARLAEQEIFAEALSQAASEELLSQRFVAFWDPVWGRPDLLFERLGEALGANT